MKNILCSSLLLSSAFLFLNCDKPGDNSGNNDKRGTVSGKVVDAANHGIAGASITIEHTVWYNSYVKTNSNNNGQYAVNIPADPAGSWTAKAQLEKSAYGQSYKFDLAPDNTAAFSGTAATTRNFTWKLSGTRPDGNHYYGAHVDLYQWGTDVQPDAVKLHFTPIDNTLIDGSPATSFERPVEDVAGTFMAKDIPIGHYKVKVVYANKTLLLDNRHDNFDAAQEKEVIFGKAGTLGETEYNIEFWLTE